MKERIREHEKRQIHLNGHHHLHLSSSFLPLPQSSSPTHPFILLGTLLLFLLSGLLLAGWGLGCLRGILLGGGADGSGTSCRDQVQGSHGGGGGYRRALGGRQGLLLGHLQLGLLRLLLGHLLLLLLGVGGEGGRAAGDVDVLAVVGNVL